MSLCIARFFACGTPLGLLYEPSFRHHREMNAATCVTVVLMLANFVATASESSITFGDAVHRAMAYEVGATTAELGIDEAQAGRLAARSAVSPNVFVAGSYTRLDHDRALGGRLLSGKNQGTGSINATIPVIAPRRWADLQEASWAIRVAKRAHFGARRLAAIRAAEAYLDVVTSKRTVEVAKESVDTGHAHFAIADSRFRAGIGNRLDVLRADDALGESEVQLQSSLAKEASSKERLGVIVGSAVALDVADEWPERLNVAPAEVTEQHIQEHVRADLGLAFDELLRRQKIRKDAWLDYMPTLLATGQFFLQDPPTTQYPKHGWQLQAIVTLPLFENGLRRGQRMARWADEHKAHLELDALERQARADLRAATTVLTRAEQAVRDAQRRHQSAKQSVTLTSQAYKRGTITSLEVVDAERRGRDAATAAAVAEDALRRARLDVLVAAGLFPISEVPAYRALTAAR